MNQASEGGPLFSQQFYEGQIAGIYNGKHMKFQNYYVKWKTWRGFNLAIFNKLKQ